MNGRAKTGLVGVARALSKLGICSRTQAQALIHAGADFSFSLHYNPNGTAAVDLTRAGFTVA